MKIYKVFYWRNGDFNFEFVEVLWKEGKEQAIFTYREYCRSKGILSQTKISHASLYL